MPTPSARLGLLKPSTADPFVTADLARNWQKLDDYPGYYVCKSTTRPQWGAAQAGMLISETDTGLLWRWDGTTFNRVNPTGMLKTTSGAWALAQRSTTFSTTSTTYVVALSVNNVVVPPGRRTIMVTANWHKIDGTSGMSYLALSRSNVNNQGPWLVTFSNPGKYNSSIADEQGAGGTFVAWEPNGLPPGTYSFSVQFRAASGTSYVHATTNTPLEIAVAEL